MLHGMICSRMQLNARMRDHCRGLWHYCLPAKPGGMQLMDLPDDCLALIIFHMLKMHDWYALDLALCNKRLLRVMNDNTFQIIELLRHKPWLIENGELHALDWKIYIDDPRGLKSALYYLKKGWIKRLVMHCIVLPEPRFGYDNLPAARSVQWKIRHEWKATYDTMLEGWPANKVVLCFPNL